MLVVTNEMRFTSNDKYEAWSFIFTTIVVFLCLAFLLSTSFYFMMSMTKDKINREKREKKWKDIQEQEAEYADYLNE